MLKRNTDQLDSVKYMYYKLFLSVIDEMMSMVPIDTTGDVSGAPDMDAWGR